MRRRNNITNRNYNIGGFKISLQCINMIHNMIGVGSLTFAAIFKEASLIPAVILALITCACEITSSLQIVQNMIESKKQTFLGIARFVFGDCWARTVEIIKTITTVFSSLAFAIAALDCIPEGLEEIFGINIFIGRLAVTIYMYLSLIYFVTRPNIEDLGFLSTLGVILFFTSSIIIIVFMLAGFIEIEDRKITPLNIKSSIFEALSSISLSFAMHYNIPRYFMEFGYNPEQNPDVDHKEPYEKMKKAILFSNIVAIIWYMLIGGVGYYVFGDSVKGDIINSFNKDAGITISIIKIALGISLVTAIPLVIYPAQDGITNNIYGKKNNNRNNVSELGNNSLLSNNQENYGTNNLLSQDINNQENEAHEESLLSQNNSISKITEDHEIVKTKKIISVILLTIVMTGSYFINDLKELLTLKGATLIVFFVYILPSIDGIFIGFKNNKSLYQLKTPICIFLFGMTCLIGGVYAWYEDYIDSNQYI